MDRLDWLFFCAFLAAVSFAVGILIGAYREYRRMKPKEQGRTHRRTWEKP